MLETEFLFFQGMKKRIDQRIVKEITMRQQSVCRNAWSTY